MMGLQRILGGALAHVRTTGIAAALLSGVLLSACGQKGPLMQRPQAPDSAQTDSKPALPPSPRP